MGHPTFIKCDIVSARRFGVGPLRISCMVQKLVWLNRFVNATIFGATVYLSFLVHAQLVSSSGWMSANAGKSSNVICPASSSGGIRSALNTTASKSLMEEFIGRLCVLLGGVAATLIPVTRPLAAVSVCWLASNVMAGCWCIIKGKIPLAELLRRRLLSLLFIGFLSQCLRKWPFGVAGAIVASRLGAVAMVGELAINGIAWPEPMLRLDDTSLNGESSRRLR